MKANLDKNLAPAWVSGKSYSTGEFCLYNKRLYICTTDNSDAEFDNSKWETRNLVDLVSGGNSNLMNFEKYSSHYSYYNAGNVSQPTKSMNITLQQGQYAIVACWNGGRTQVAPVVTGCTEIGRTQSDYGSVTSTADGGIAYLIIYKADIDGATITHNASWGNCGAIVFD